MLPQNNLPHRSPFAAGFLLQKMLCRLAEHFLFLGYYTNFELNPLTHVGLNSVIMRSRHWWATARLRPRPFLTKFILDECLKVLIRN